MWPTAPAEGETLRLKVETEDRENSARLLESATINETTSWRRERVKLDDFCFAGLQTSLKHRQSKLATTLNEIDDLLAMKRNLTTKCKKLIKKTKVVPSQIVHEAETGYRARGAKCNIHSQKPGSHQINEGEDKARTRGHHNDPTTNQSN
mmetsp:Transcript_30917/g.95684  ORF Transcript_30917/g.95684 Transcript_30917/m.95684 type:complete len:150 (+) Transcript_30917:87-536(+)